MNSPTFDELRYLDSWAGLIERYGKETTLQWLIVWQVLNKWDIEWYPKILVYVFGHTIDHVVPGLMKNPPAFSDARFKFIEGDNYPARLTTYCEAILKTYKWWSVYDP